MNVLDLFSGIGGFSLGLERAGMKTIAFCEIDKHCQKVLTKHWPDIPIFEDIKLLTKDTLDQNNIKNIDLICGGFPCQDISVAGKQKGLEGERSGLWFEYKRLIEEVGPEWVIIENVANLRGKGLGRVLKDLWSIGYDAEWHIISARSVGACHLRERVWIIAYPKSERYQGRVQGFRKSEEDVFQEKLSWPTPCLCGNATHANVPRLWRSFASEKEKSEWWAKTTASYRSWWEIESELCRISHGVSGWLYLYRGELNAEEAKRILENLSNMQNPIYEKKIREEIRGYDSVCIEKDMFSILWKLKKESESQDNLSFEGKVFFENFMREMWAIQETGGPSYRQELQKQFGDQFNYFVPLLPHETSLESRAYKEETTRPDKGRRERIKQLGNAVVPQIPELIGRAIMDYENKKEK